jgi:hypothetical protein
MSLVLSTSTLLLLAVILWSMGGAPHYQRYTWEQRHAQAQSRAEATAVRQAAKAARQAARRRLFGSHPMLYGLLAWLSPVLLVGLLCALVP